MAYTKHKKWKYLEIMVGIYPGIGFGWVMGIDNDPIEIDLKREVHIIIGILCFHIGFIVPFHKLNRNDN